MQWLNGATQPINLSLYNGIGQSECALRPQPGWAFPGTYWSNHNVGSQALDCLRQQPWLVQSHWPNRFDYQTHNIEFGGEYTGNGWSLGLKYNGSFFTISLVT